MRIEDLQNSLEIQELRIIERNSEREVEQTLKVSSSKKNQKQSCLEVKKKHSDDYQKSEASNSDEKKHQKENEKFDKKKIQRYCCKKFDHFVVDCWSNKERKSEKENVVRGEFDDKIVLLMTSEFDGEYLLDWWYMDIGCSNHLTENNNG